MLVERFMGVNMSSNTYSLYLALAIFNIMFAFIPPFDLLSVFNLTVGVWLALVAYNEYHTQ